MKKVPEIIKTAARKLRKNQTPSEQIIWDKVRDMKLGYKFQRQFCLYVYTEDSGLDRYIIPDFYCSEKKLIVEIDGNIHDDVEVYNLDRYKESLLKDLGFTIMRFKNNEVHNNIEIVLKKIKAHISKLQPLALEKSKDSGKSSQFKSELDATEDVKILSPNQNASPCEMSLLTVKTAERKSQSIQHEALGITAHIAYTQNISTRTFPEIEPASATDSCGQSERIIIKIKAGWSYMNAKNAQKKSPTS